MTPEIRAKRLRNLGRNVAYRRMSSNMTQEYLARLSGISAKTLAQMERGEHACRIDMAMKIADGFRISLPALMQNLDREETQA